MASCSRGSDRGGRQDSDYDAERCGYENSFGDSSLDEEMNLLKTERGRKRVLFKITWAKCKTEAMKFGFWCFVPCLYSFFACINFTVIMIQYTTCIV